MINKKTVFLLFLICLFSLIVRIFNLSPFKIYPDAYQNLLIAENLQKTGTVFATLGENGYFFPPFISWTRPGFPLLINLADYFNHDSNKSSQFLSLLLGILAIPLSFLFLNFIFKSKKLSLLGSLLFAVSWNHIVWGGFIGTETTGVFSVLLLYLFFFKSLRRESKFADLEDFLVGIFFSISVLIRYEYILLALPIFLTITRQKITPLPKLLNIFGISALIFSLIGKSILPLNSIISNLAEFKYSLILLAIFIAFFAAKYVSKKLIFIILLIFAFFVIYMNDVPLLGNFTAAFEFLKTDFILGFFAVMGFISLSKNKKFQNLNFFLLIGFILLLLVYHQINPYMQRYWTHLLPFIIIWSSYGFYQMIKGVIPAFGDIPVHSKFFGDIPVHRGVPFMLFILFLLQVIISSRGLKYWKNGEYFRTSYEEKSAKLLLPHLNKDSFLLASFPEPYYFFTSYPTQSIADIPPFIYFELPDDKEITIINDMGMRDIFPKFSQFIDKSLEDYKIGEYSVKENYHFAERSEPESHPVILYKIPFNELKNKIKLLPIDY